MSHISIKILDAAHKDGLFNTRPTKNQQVYIKPSILTVWDILDAIKKHSVNGIDGQSIADKLSIHHNTLKIYLRWMRSKKLIVCESEKAPGSKHIFYPKEH